MISTCSTKTLHLEAFLLGMPKFYVILAIDPPHVNMEMGESEVAGTGNSIPYVTSREIPFG